MVSSNIADTELPKKDIEITEISHIDASCFECPKGHVHIIMENNHGPHFVAGLCPQHILRSGFKELRYGVDILDIPYHNLAKISSNVLHVELVACDDQVTSLGQSDSFLGLEVGFSRALSTPDYDHATRYVNMAIPIIDHILKDEWALNFMLAFVRKVSHHVEEVGIVCDEIESLL